MNTLAYALGLFTAACVIVSFATVLIGRRLADRRWREFDDRTDWDRTARSGVPLTHRDEPLELVRPPLTPGQLDQRAQGRDAEGHGAIAKVGTKLFHTSGDNL
ncbi:MAG: hypothetical protein ACOYBT_10025 [Polynucleobacter sp.]